MRLSATTILALFLAYGTSSALAADRHALVIANSSYGDILHAEAEVSARSAADQLRARGFQVLSRTDLDKTGLRTEIERFFANLPTNSVANLHFAGVAHADPGDGKRGARLWLQGAGQTSAGKKARDASVALDRWFVDLLETRTGASRVLLTVDAPAGHVLLGEDGEAPTVDTVRGLRLPDGVEMVLGGPAEFARQLPDGSKVRWGTELREGGSAGEVFVNAHGMVFVWCPPGAFRMGQQGYVDAAPVDVQLTRGFWMGKYELTQREMVRIRGKLPNAHRGLAHRNAPVTAVGDGGIVRKFNESERVAGRLPADWRYQLPTEAQWEYACRAGSTARYGFGNSRGQLHLYGNFADLSLRTANPDYHYASSAGRDGAAESFVPVGRYRANAWGIHDMHGNVAELCRDVHTNALPGGLDPLVDSARGDPRSKGVRVMRGGAWCSPAEYCQSGFRSLSYGGGGGELAFEGMRFVLARVAGR